MRRLWIVPLLALALLASSCADQRSHAQAVYMLAHATGLSDAKASTAAMERIRKGIQDNLYSGLLPWPFIIERTR